MPPCTEGMQHTPGPWTWTSFGHLIAPRSSGDVLGLIRYVPDEVEIVASKADKSLIAAAPDLLAALEAIERDSEDEISRDCARAAIAKARGFA